MTQEDKSLLLKDLCARFPYRVVVETQLVNAPRAKYPVLKVLQSYMLCDYMQTIENVIHKPYLRPMSSMTEEEKNELRKEQIKDEQLFTDCIKNYPEMRGLVIPHFAADWCNKNMFDYRGLIERGLAIEVPEDINKKGE